MTDIGGTQAELLISGPGGQRAIPLKGRVVVLGRQRDCDVVMDDDRVSRRHARLFLDPFGRWIVEDLGSRCGVWMAGQRVEAQAVGPAESFHIRPYSFRVRENLGRSVEANPLSLAASTIVEERMEEVSEAQTPGPLSLQRTTGCTIGWAATRSIRPAEVLALMALSIRDSQAVGIALQAEKEFVDPGDSDRISGQADGGRRPAVIRETPG